MKLSALNPVARRFYEAMISGLNGQFDASSGTHVEASLFARARGFARTWKVLRRAADQILPTRVYEMLPDMEASHELIPAADATVPQRRAALSARFLLPGGAGKVNVENALRTLLGDDFIAYRPTTIAEAVNYPASASSTEITFQLPQVQKKIVRIAGTFTMGLGVTPGISTNLGAPQMVAYEMVTGTPEPSAPASAADLLVGDVLTVSPGLLGLQERIVVTAVTVFEFTGPVFTAVFEKAHEPDTLGVTGSFPSWQSTKRHSLVVLTPAAAGDPETRRQVNDLMDRMSRCVSTWAIAEGTTSTTSGPFTVGGGKLGVTTIGAIALP